LTSEAAASLQAGTDDGDADESASPPAKHAKTDSRSALLKFLATAAVTLVPAELTRDFDRFLVAPAPSGVDALGWWQTSRTSILLHGELLDDRLITNYQVTMIGYGKTDFHIPKLRFKS